MNAENGESLFVHTQRSINASLSVRCRTGGMKLLKLIEEPVVEETS